MKDLWDEVEFLRKFVGVGNFMDFCFSSYWIDIFGWAHKFFQSSHPESRQLNIKNSKFAKTTATRRRVKYLINKL